MPGTGKLVAMRQPPFFMLTWSVEQFTVPAPLVDGAFSGDSVPDSNALANRALVVIVPRIFQPNAPVGRVKRRNAHCWSTGLVSRQGTECRGMLNSRLALV